MTFKKIVSEKIDWGCTLLIMCIIAMAALHAGCSSSDKQAIVSDDPEKAYMIAKASYDKKDYLDAIDEFSVIKLKYSGSNIIDKAVFYLGMSYYYNEEYILAVYEFESLMKSYPTSGLVEDAAFYSAMCYYNLSPDYALDQSYTKFALSSLQDYVELYPNGKNRAIAESRIMEMKNKLALKAYKSAEMYYELGSYKSSIVYYDYVLDEFFDSDYADDALYGKIQSLNKKKLYTEAFKEIERFEKRFPSSPLLPKVKALKSKTL
jgi:outer membrane protein assembly factor BamD